MHVHDDSGPAGERKKYFETRVHREDGRLHEHYSSTDKTERTIAQSGTETLEQAQEALEQNKRPEVFLGPKHFKKNAGTLHIQAPIKPTKWRKKSTTRSLSCYDDDDEFRSLGCNEDGGEAMLRSGGGDDGDGPPCYRDGVGGKKTNCVMGRCNEGADAGVAKEFSYLDWEYDVTGGAPVVTHDLIVVIDKGAVPTEKDVRDAAALIEEGYRAAQKSGGKRVRLSSKEAQASGHVSTEPMSKKAKQDIKETLDAMQVEHAKPKTNLPEGLFAKADAPKAGETAAA